MSSLKNHFSSPQAIRWGFALLAIHTALVLITLWNCYRGQYEGGGGEVFVWLTFIVGDFPSVPLAACLIYFSGLMNTNLMVALVDWGYEHIGSGISFFWAIVAGLVGGLQWYYIGRWIGALISRHQEKKLSPQ